MLIPVRRLAGASRPGVDTLIPDALGRRFRGGTSSPRIHALSRPIEAVRASQRPPAGAPSRGRIVPAPSRGVPAILLAPAGLGPASAALSRPPGHRASCQGRRKRLGCRPPSHRHLDPRTKPRLRAAVSVRPPPPATATLRRPWGKKLPSMRLRIGERTAPRGRRIGSMLRSIQPLHPRPGRITASAAPHQPGRAGAASKASAPGSTLFSAGL